MNAHPPVNPPHGEATSDRKAVSACPYCGQAGAFASLSEDTTIGHNTYVSVRKCLNVECRGVVFYYRGKDGIVKTLPYRGIEDGRADAPPAVGNALEEATICHANGCYVAAAVMVRRALAKLCDEVGIAEGDLSVRLESLGKIIVIPPALLTGLRDLRMVRDAAASSESGIYSAVSRKEVEVGIDCTKTILKALYQYESLVGRLEALKDGRTTP